MTVTIDEEGSMMEYGGHDAMTTKPTVDLSLMEILRVLLSHKMPVLGMPFVVGLVATGIAFLLPNIYTGRAVLMPPQQQQSNATAMLNQLGVLAGVASTTLGIKNPNDLYVGMLRSRTVADALIARFGLKERYEEDTQIETRRALARETEVTSGKDGLIVVEVRDKDPQVAAKLANAYVEELSKLTQTLAISEASQRRLFFEQQLTKAKEELITAELELKKTQEKTGTIVLTEQGKATIEAAAVLRGQVAAKEVELAAMRTFAASDNPDYRRRQEELRGLRTQLAKIERNTKQDTGDILLPMGKMPAVGLEYARRLRDLKYQETIFELMAKQFEIAKLDEARDSTLIQLVDSAVPPDLKSAPSRLTIISLAMFFSFLAVASYFVYTRLWRR
jgi:tyrosine-protein kinase Etk/Wzc